MREGLILNLLDTAGHKHKRSGNQIIGPCPSCKGGNKTPCCSFDPVKNCWNCFSCGESGNLKKLAGLLGINFSEFLEREGVSLQNTSETQVQNAPSPLPGKVLDISAITKIEMSEPTQEWLHSRGIDTSLRSVYLNCAELRPAKEGPLSWFYRNNYRLTIPMHAPDGTCKSLKIRCVGDPPKGSGKAVNLKGYSPIAMGWNQLPIIKELNSVVIVEGEMDFLSLLSAGLQNVLAVPAATYNFHSDELAALPDNVYVLLDNDQAGKDNAMRVAKQIHSHRKPRRNVYICSYPSAIKDANELLMGTSNQEQFRGIIEEIMRDSTTNKYTPFETSADTMDSIISQLREKIETAEARGENRPEVKRVSTGIPQLDSMLRGGIRSGVYAIAGRPGVGKTSIILSLAKSILKSNPDIYTSIFSIEMTKEEMVSQLISWECGISRHRILDYDVDRYGLQMIEKALREKEIFSRLVVDDKSRTVSGFKSATIDIMNESESRCVVFIDYLQQIQPETEKRDMRLAMKDVAYALKDFANTYQVPIFVISSTQREQYKAGAVYDLLTSFKESGDIEYSLYGGFYLEEIKELGIGQEIGIDDKGRPFEKPIRISLVKHRHGGCRDSQGNYLAVDLALNFYSGQIRRLDAPVGKSKGGFDFAG